MKFVTEEFLKFKLQNFYNSNSKGLSNYFKSEIVMCEMSVKQQPKIYGQRK